MSINCLCFFFTFLLSSCLCCLCNSTSDSLDGFARDLAFKALSERRAHTGVLYKAILPANLSGMEVSVVRLRSRRLWNRGAANFSCFQIPSRTMPMPHVKRLALVHQNLGNWSSHYYTLPGYSLVSSVVGFMVYDASNTSYNSTTKLSLKTMGKPILVQFPNVTLDQGTISKAKCASFATNGTISLTEMRHPGVCYATEQGHFSIVLRLKRKRSLKFLWVVGFVLASPMIVLVGYVGMASLKRLKAKKIQVMEKQAEEDLVLENRWVLGSKMPSAAVTRTLPALENGSPCHGSSDHLSFYGLAKSNNY
ncbi:hypothetical protein PRUPE_5G112200 [Prunus persica]|uniref:Transmembrane protein n=1 Tax=Prunus persica TaxID=3760 RepID=A0A251PAB8_PRUPE|nr:uncharacterized protein LOC18776684 [Prunus persica]ONI07305.1 hypothetical protein PRUPE_5G112200 [Prunus persica]